MATTLKVLGQAAPVAATETDLALVPGATEYLISTIVIANRSATDSTYRLSISVGGGATQTKDYIGYGSPIAGNDVVAMTVGIGLAQTDVVRCWDENGTVSFSVFGQAQT